MAIKPGLQCSLSCVGIVGLIKPKVLPLTKKTESEIFGHLKTCQFNSQALEIHVTSVDDKVSYPLAVFMVEPKVVGRRYIT